VFGITRRGSGSLPTNNLDTLVADIRAVLDMLGVGPVVLAGHSIAGEEMNRFCETNAQLLAADAASFAARRAYGARVSGVRDPKSELRATARFDASGRHWAR
jgi:pimeloyl-ACP methyl ester carboxylesterase